MWRGRSGVGVGVGGIITYKELCPSGYNVIPSHPPLLRTESLAGGIFTLKVRN